MNRRKLYLMTAVTITSIALLSGCGKKDTTETAIAGEIETESIMLETEELETETETEIETETETEISQLKPTMGEDGKLHHPDYPEDYVKFEPMEEKTMYIIKEGPILFDPNMTAGELATWGRAFPKGETSDGEMTVNGKCEIDGVEYYTSEAEGNLDENLTVIIEASCLSDTPPAEETASTSTDSSDTSSNTSSESELTDEELKELLGLDEDIVYFENVPQTELHTEWTDEELDAAEGRILE